MLNSKILEKPHPNVIIRKKIKSKGKLGECILEIHDEILAGVYPTITHRARLNKFGLHNSTWNQAFSGISKRVGKNMVVTIPQDGMLIIEWAQKSMELYRSSPAWAKNLLENVCLYHLKSK